MAQAETGALCGAEAQREDMFVVGIGASAGGLEALQQFFRFHHQQGSEPRRLHGAKPLPRRKLARHLYGHPRGNAFGL